MRNDGLEELPIAEVAATWVVRLGSEDPQERAHAELGFAQWKAQDPRHEKAAARMEGLLAQMQALRTGPTKGVGARPAVAALQAGQHAQRKARTKVARGAGGALLVAALLGFPVWTATHGYPPTHMLADINSYEGQWRQRTLSDGSQITLSGASAVDVRFDEHRRVVQLLRGSVLVQVAKDAARPFLVVTPAGSVRALGTRFTVSYGAGGMVLEMLESRVAVQTAAQLRAGSTDALTVSAGQRLVIGSDGLTGLETMEPASVDAGWSQHRLVVHGRPLPEVLDQIALHHPGAIHFNRQQLAGIKVSGVYPLQNTMQALQLLQRSLPRLQLKIMTQRVVLVSLAPGAGD